MIFLIYKILDLILVSAKETQDIKKNRLCVAITNLLSIIKCLMPFFYIYYVKKLTNTYFMPTNYSGTKVSKTFRNTVTETWKMWISCFLFNYYYVLLIKSEDFYLWTCFSSWRRKRQPSTVLLPGKSHGGRSLVGYGPRGHKESDTTEQLHFTFLHEYTENESM